MSKYNFSDGNKIYIMAGRFDHALDFAIKYGIKHAGNIRYINNFDKVCGLHGKDASGKQLTVYAIGEYYKTKDYVRILGYLQLKEFKIEFVKEEDY